MLRIILSGCNGKMGRVVSEAIRERDDCIVVAGFDIKIELKQDFPVMSDPSDYEGNADMIIDFSNSAFLPKLLTFASARKIPAVIATTGLNDEQMSLLKKASEIIPVFCSANMSLGVNLMIELSKKAASILPRDFDVEIVEQHHNQKIDAPSGTALMIANAISSVEPEEPEYVYDRHLQRKKRSKNEIGIHSVRGGTIVGDHEVIFAGNDEIITIRHTALSKKIFANGAVNAALFLKDQKPGLYSMNDLVSHR